MDRESPVMTSAEVCAYLQIGYGLLMRMVRARKFPAFRIGADYRFNIESVDRWRLAQPTAQGNPRGRK